MIIMPPEISIIIPARNEEGNIESTIVNCYKKVSPEKEIIVIDDHSSDKTYEIVNSLKKKFKYVRIFKNENNAGFGNALRFGFQKANGKYIVPVMADLCDDPGTINKMYEKAEEGFDIVCGCRYMKGSDMINSPIIKKFISKNYGKLINMVLGIPTKDITNAFKLYRKTIFENIEIEKNDFSISVEIPLKAYFKKYRITDVPTIWYGRKKGKSKFKIFKMGKSYFNMFIFGLKKSMNFVKGG